MRRFVVQPCKMRGTRFAPLKSLPLEWDWEMLRERLVPKGATGVRLEQAINNIRGMSIGCYIGIVESVREPGMTNNFIFMNHDRNDPEADWVVSKDPSFPERIVEVYQVLEIDWGVKCRETEKAIKGRANAIRSVKATPL